MNIKKQKTSDILYRYLYNILSRKKGLLGYDQTKIIFLNALEDYFDNSIDIHVLSSVSTTIYYDFSKPSGFDISSSFGQLGNLLNETSELEWLSKNNGESEVKVILEKLQKYLDENKHLLLNENVE